MRLIDRLAALHPGASRRTIRGWLAHARIRVNGRVERRADAPVGPDDRVELGPAAPPPFPSPLRLVWEDDEILVVDKPPGLLTIATDRERDRTAYAMLAEYVERGAGGRGPWFDHAPGAEGGPRPGAVKPVSSGRRGTPRDQRGSPTGRRSVVGGVAERGAAGLPARRPRLFIVHRLDRETSGLLVFAKSAGAKEWLQQQFAARSVERVYQAVVEGRVRTPAGELRHRLVEDRTLRVRATRDRRAGKEAITRYRVLERRRDSTLLELTLTTGRRGQIRTQLAALGHPIVGDHAYGSRRNPLGRVCLHATRLGFTDLARRRRTFESPPPRDFARA